MYGDMRMIQVPEPGDIIVSELLGSFGDNELSPECLDGAMRFLKRKLCPRLFIRNLTRSLSSHSRRNIHPCFLLGLPCPSVLVEIV